MALAGIDARFVMQTAWPTPTTAGGLRAELAATTAGVPRAHGEIVYEGMGVSVAGRVDDSGRLVFAPNLRWPAVDSRQLIEAAVGLPVSVENAASACALAELWFGRHADDVKHLVAVTVSEGIGVGLLLNGQLSTATTRWPANSATSRSSRDGHAVPLRQARMLGAVRVEHAAVATTGTTGELTRIRTADGTRADSSATSFASPKAVTPRPSRRWSAWRTTWVIGLAPSSPGWRRKSWSSSAR